MSKLSSSAQDMHTFENFEALHNSQLKNSGVPEIFWKTLFKKLNEEVFDAGSYFSVQKIEYETETDPDLTKSQPPDFEWQVIVSNENGIDKDDPKSIFLIDHAWCYQIYNARSQLEQVPGLLHRMAALMETAPQVDAVLASMWKHNQTYRFHNCSTSDDEKIEPMWYVMDEFGSRIQHCGEPNIRAVPFLFLPSEVSYTVFWPVQNLESGDEITRDFAESVSDPLLREIRLIPWFEPELPESHIYNIEYPPDYFQGFFTDELPVKTERPVLNLPARVFTDDANVRKFLTDDRFQFTDDQNEASILWIKSSFHQYRKLSIENPNVLINQFPNENSLTNKNLLAIVGRKAATDDKHPPWLPFTYNLVSEFPNFVSLFNQRETLGLDNHWIIKPWNLARGLDMHITNSLTQIVRLSETRPKVACKYVENPVLFLREDVGSVKFDVRYVVLLVSTNPLTLYVNKVFWLRFANRPYSLDELDNYQKHYTVMNYIENGKQLKQIHHDEFIIQFEKQYPQFDWETIEGRIFECTRELFTAAANEAFIPDAPQSRALFALDFVLEKRTNQNGEDIIQPVICEVNFAPDCERACKYHPDFYNNVFEVLFLEKTNESVVKIS